MIQTSAGIYHSIPSSRRLLVLPLLLSILVLISFIDTVSSQHNTRRKYGSWNTIPSSSSPFLASHQGYAFMNECESLAAFVEKLRGGGREQSDPRDYDRFASRSSSSSSSSRYYHDKDDYDEDDYYDYKKSSSRRNHGPNSPPPPPRAAFFSQMPSVIRNGNRQIGLGLLGSGTVITMLGISLFFNKTLMRLGNLLFIAGVPMTLGPSRTLGYFVKPEKFRATGCLVLGIFLVFIGMPVFGIILEAFGILNLFGNLFPFVWAVAKNMPGIGPILNMGNSSRKNNSKNRNDERYSYDTHPDGDYYYDDDYGRGNGDDRDYENRQSRSNDRQYYY